MPYYPGYFLKKWFEDNRTSLPYKVPLRNGEGFLELMNKNPKWINARNNNEKNNVLLKFGSPINSRYFVPDGLSFSQPNDPFYPTIDVINLNRETFGSGGRVLRGFDVEPTIDEWPQYSGWEPNVIYADGEYIIRKFENGAMVSGQRYKRDGTPI